MKTGTAVKRMAQLLGVVATSLLLFSGCLPLALSPTPAPTADPLPTETPPALPAQLAASAPAVNIRFDHIGLAEGLSHSVVTSLLQDSQGFIWIGTQDGLNRFDAYTFKIFQPDPNDPHSLSDRWINTLYEDHQGTLWIGTRLGGLNRYDPTTGTFTSFRNDPASPSSLVSNRVQAILEDSQSRLWVGTAEGLDRLSPARQGFEHYEFSLLPNSERGSDNITCLMEDSLGRLWVGTAYTGLNLYDEQSDSFINYSNDPEDTATLSSNHIRDIQEDPGGGLWIATDFGLNLFDPSTGRAIHYVHANDDPGSLSGNTVRVVYLDNYGNLWAGTSSGLERYDRLSGDFFHYRNDPGLESSLSNDIVTAIGESRDGALWFGTNGGGLNKYYRGQDYFRYYHYAASKPGNLGGRTVRAIHVDPEGIVWIGTLEGGLDRLDPLSGEITHYQNDPANPGSLSSDEVYSIFTDHTGTLWVGTAAGLDMLVPGASDFTHFQHDAALHQSLIGSPVYTILEDSLLNLWVGTEFGLEKYDRSTRSFFHFQNQPGNLRSLSGNEVETLFESSQGELWIGTFNDGLNRFDLPLGLFDRFQNDPLIPASLSNDSILSLYEDSRGTLWIGTSGGGLDRYDPGTGTFTHYGEADGLPNNVIACILEDGKGSLWLSTNHGLSRFDPLTGKSTRNYTASDGLQGNEFDPNACSRGLDGNLYFGGVNGLTVFDPTVLSDSSYAPPVVLVSISHNGIPLNTDSVPEKTTAVELRWPQTGFEFSYAALGFAQPAKNQYAYMLENLDSQWNEVGVVRSGRYTNLPGGTYVLRIKASNQDGLWNETGLSVLVQVVPPVYQTTWFRLSMGGLLALLAGGAYWVRMRGIQRYNRQLEAEVTERTHEIERLFEKTKELAVVEERNRLARELHDSAKQKAFAALAQLGTAKGVLKKDARQARNHLGEAENLVYEVIEELTFLIQEMYPAALKEKGLATTLREYIFEWESRTDIQADVLIESERPLRLEVEQAIYRVVQEALSNVSRHSRARKVEIVLSYQKDQVVGIVADDGCGFDPKLRPGGLGLRSIRERIESLGGKVTIESPLECGTRLTVRIPLEATKRKNEEAT